MNLVRKISRVAFYFVIKLNQIARENKHYNRLYAYYSFPILVGLLITFTLVRFLIGIFPAAALTINGTHVHHFTSGIFILLGAGYVALWVKSWKLRYVTALAYGVGTGFIFDEFYVWLGLNDSVLSHSQYDAVIIVSIAFLVILLLPSGISAIYRIFNN